MYRQEVLERMCRPVLETLEPRLLLDGVTELVPLGAGPPPPVVERPFIPCDVNQDGKVDGGDLAVWQSHYDPTGHNVNAWWHGDLNGDGKVDGGDLALWQRAYDVLGSPPSGVYAEFNQFALDNYGAECDDLVYQTFGNDIAFVESGDWVYESVESASVAFETNLPAWSYVQHGANDVYGHMSRPAERPFAVHVHYLKDLDPSSTVHYRLVTMDERGNVLFSEDRTLDTTSYAGKTRISAQGSGATYALDQAGKTYVVAEDLVLDGMAFDITADNVTLDLNGHTVVYNNTHNGLVSGSFWDYINNSEFGVKATGVSGLRIYNGTIRQGAGLDSAGASSIGFNPIYARGCSTMTVAGVTVAYSGTQMIGLYNHWQGTGFNIHHNVFEDHGTTVDNRHGAGCRALVFYGSSNPSTSNTHHNLVKRTRHMGIQGALVSHNEVYVDSWDTNSFGVGLDPGGIAEGNRVFGTGYHVCAFGWGDQLTIRDNFVHLQGVAPTARSSEYGASCSLNGMRLTQYGGGTHLYRDNLYEGNVILAYGREGCSIRGVQFFSDPYVSDLIFRNNTVKVIAQDAATTQVACVVTQGLQDRTEQHLPILYEDNTFIANRVHIRFGDSYGVGSNHQFISCEFIRQGSSSNYFTFYYDTYYPCKYHIIRDAVFSGGATASSVHWMGSGPDHDYTIEWTLTVNTTPGATVTIVDKYGTTAFSGVADTGSVSVPLTQFINRFTGKTYYSPYDATATLGNLSAATKVFLNQILVIDLIPV